jgi:hypothetical protein
MRPKKAKLVEEKREILQYVSGELFLKEQKVYIERKPRSKKNYILGGGRGIRTLDGIAPKPPFQGGAIGH